MEVRDGTRRKHPRTSDEPAAVPDNRRSDRRRGGSDAGQHAVRHGADQAHPAGQDGNAAGPSRLGLAVLTDGKPDQIASQLATIGCGVMVKTHDGLDWMSTYDHAPGAISGPGQVQTVAAIFERLR